MAKADSTETDDLDKSKIGEDDESQDDTEKVDNTDTEETDEETDETNDESDDSDDESEDDESDGDSEDEDEDESDTSFKKRYTQLKGDTPLEYIKSVETAYQESSNEGIRQKHRADEAEQKNKNWEAKWTALISQNPDLAKELEASDDQPDLSPALLRAEEQLQNEMRTEYTDFMETHTSLADDPDLQKKMLDRMSRYSENVRKTERRQPSMKEALTFAASALGIEPDSNDEDNLRMTAKNTAARGKNAKTTTKKKAKQPEFTDAQVSMGMKMGIGKTREEVIKKFREHANK